MKRRWIAGLLLCLLALPPMAARAESAFPMAAVGVLSARAEGGCSAALIAPDVVLTAAHCVDARGKPGGLTFRTGAYPGLPRISVPVAATAFHPLYDLNLPREITRIRFDLALVRLAHPIDTPGIVPLRLGPAPEVGERLILASYRGGRGERARERRCEIFAGPPDVAALGCEVASGESGSPVLRLSPQGPEIAAVLSSRSRFDQQPIGFAPPVLRRIGPVMDLLPEAAEVTPAGEGAPATEIVADP
ncbi:trypsin-like serine peptidase [Palleronia sp. KMU-117]|uniref:trypsin-like serine peptidase n=1 Tax=Palleronia sp. KMU-117 TaxID=3434108 RepID=UPI003D70A5CB